MHYANGREAKNGDKVVSFGYGGPVIGILYDANAGNDYCNGKIAVTKPNDPCPNLKECLHLDDVIAPVARSDGCLGGYASRSFQESRASTRRLKERNPLKRAHQPNPSQELILMIERRFVKGAQVRAKKRAEGGNDEPSLEGYAAVFGEDYVLYESKYMKVIERVKEGAFTRALDEKQDVRCCFNHNPDNVLARTTNGTLSLSQDKKGLPFEANLDARTHIAQDVLCFVDRGDVTGCSFAFCVRKQNFTDIEEDGFVTCIREIEDVDLYELGPVLFPAYEGTNVGAARTAGTFARELRTAAWAERLPAEIRTKLVARANDAGAEDGVCNCDCDACVNCENKRSAMPGAGNLLNFDTERTRAQADVDARTRRLGLPAPIPAS